MGLRTAAARLGLGLVAASATASAKQKLMRRSSTLAAADIWEKKVMKSESEMELESNKEKTVYLCFFESSQCGAVEYLNQVIRPIRLSQVNSNDDADDIAVELREAAYKRSKVNLWYSNCSRFGSQILVAGGRRRPPPGIVGPAISRRDIYWFDTTQGKFQVSSPTKTKIKSFSTGKQYVLLGELNRKLYCIENNPFSMTPPSQPFQVLDPENDLKWRSLEAPPFIRGQESEDFTACFLEGSNKILGWVWHQPGVFCFDDTKPENGWIESPSCLGNSLPFLDHGHFFVRHHHPNLGAFNIMFHYHPDNAPLLVSTFFMPNNCDSFHPINKPLQLPELCYEFLEDENDDTFSIDSQFVHLGAQKVCLVLHKFFFPSTGKVQCGNMGSLLLITFEYDIISNTTVDSKSTLEIQTRLLGTHRRRYFTRQLRKPDYTWTNTAYLTGAFLI
ncbi:hypothetical protein ABKV19_007856 [Rosa sericea]